MEPNNRVAIVTGAGKGLGRAYALRLAAQGAAVVVNNRRHEGESDAQTSAMRTVEAIRRAGGRAEPNWDDVCDPESGRRMIETALGAFGRLDAIVANAAVERLKTLRKTSRAEFDEVFNTSFYGNFNLVHAAWPLFYDQGGGRVVLTSSGAGLYGNHGQSAYSAAKAAVIGLSRALAIEGRSRGVLVNVVAPYALTQLTESHIDGGTAREFTTERVAPLVAWLASEQCTVSGEVLVCGAGLLRRACNGESAALEIDAPFEQLLETLQHRPLRAFDSASASFDFLCEERGLRRDEGA